MPKNGQTALPNAPLGFRMRAKDRLYLLELSATSGQFNFIVDDFQFIDPAQRLKASDKEFLKLNDAAILCQLQQSLLMKHLFSHSPEQFEDFAFEIMKRESLLTITAKTPFEIYRTVVEDVTRTWFEKLINEETT